MCGNQSEHQDQGHGLLDGMVMMMRFSSLACVCISLKMTLL